MNNARRQVNKDGSEQVMLGGVILKEKPVRKRARRADWKTSPALIRLREVEKLIKARHGGMVPETDDADVYIRAAAFSRTGQDMRAWCKRWAPWAPAELIARISAAAAKRRHMMSANGVAGMLMVTMTERTRLKLKTIGACDLTLEDRKRLTKQRKNDRDRARIEEKRRAAGKVDRASYLASHSLSRLKPWEAENMSRAKWYRLRETSPSRIEGILPSSDTPVSQIPPVPVIASKRPSTGKAGRGGLGTESPTGCQGAAPLGRSDKDIGAAA
ncbi:hypothetical protein SAMN03159463_05311 [Mesorhizobium sp. NFR06]|uniref:hypothetical protein n=1 Tax=Mesorhizobium sp. NFR06 TaxID=1566290 RepID=UPI0008DF0701|nr:hypothetical protein [Mesorhizobium sp. NFR06]SFP98317.1 hypothetical protein SAMN03159463_05311 [Mesorhizobium sp. NFR06]